MTEFEDRWEFLEPGKGFKRIDESHPLDFYIGIDVSDHRVLLLVLDCEPRVPAQSQAIQVLCRQRQDGRWALMFCLFRPELGPLFSHLCEDLVESCRQIRDKSSAGDLLLSRFDRWQRLLQSGSTGLLGELEQKGLLGELLFLHHVALSVYGCIGAVEGWTGPLDAEQDFRFADAAFEIKTIGPDALTVKISSAEQLDDTDRPLQLVVAMIEHAERTDAEAFCLSGFVTQLRNELRVDPRAAALFDDRLLSAGYFDRDEYGLQFYRLRRFRRFAVGTGFPRIMRSRMSSAIGNVRYELDLHSCLPYEVPEN